MSIAIVTILIGLAIVWHTYLGHSVVLYAWSLVRNSPWSRAEISPAVSIVVAAHNEARDIQRKICNLTTLVYKGELEVVVADDGSTDDTALIANQTLGDLGRVVSSPTNIGKTAMQNLVVPQLSGEIVVFSDATSVWPVNLVEKIVQHFEDPDVGCVSVDVLFVSPNEHGATTQQQGLFWKIERNLRTLGSSIWTNIVVSGTCYAIRSDLFRPLPSEIAEDLGTPLQIASQGKRVVFDPSIRVREHATSSARNEFTMRRRIALQNITAIARYWNDIWSAPAFTIYQFLSHKVLRAVSWIGLVMIFVASIFLAIQSTVFELLLFAQITFYAFAALGYMYFDKLGSSRIFSLPTYFATLNFSYAIALFDFLRGKRAARWISDR